MAQIFSAQKIYIGDSTLSGRGVFAAQDIEAGEVIEEAPILEIPEDQVEDLMKTDLLNYFFGSGNGFESPAIILGFGSLYNHSYKPNAKFVKKLNEKVLRFVAIADIKKDQEILINYNGNLRNQAEQSSSSSKLWFET